MLFELKPHPDTPSQAINRIAVRVDRRSASLFVLEYVVSGDVGRLKLPERALPVRADNLWQHTCFEAFFGDPGIGDGYVEVNLAPSSQWATYDFGSYRSGMAPSAASVARIETRTPAVGYSLLAEVEVIDLLGDRYDRLALSAIIEEQDGTKSYWALAHAPGKPDFHHPAAFAISLADLEHS